MFQANGFDPSTSGAFGPGVYLSRQWSKANGYAHGKYTKPLYCLLLQGKSQLLPPAPPYYPFPRGKFHTRGNIWSFTAG